MARCKTCIAEDCTHSPRQDCARVVGLCRGCYSFCESCGETDETKFHTDSSCCDTCKERGL